MVPKQLLIIDDEIEVANTIGEIIDSMDFSIDYIIAHDGLEALNILKNNNIDCIVTDVNMPNCNGIDFTKHLQALGLNIPVIFISGEGNAKIEKEIKEIGGVDFLVKPFDFDSFCFLVRDTLDVA